MKNHFSKRLLAFFIAICFIFGQSNLPAGLFHLNLDGILETKAAETFNEKLTVYNIIGGETAFDVTFTFTINGANTVALTAVVSSEMTNVGSYRLDIPQTVTHGGTTYTITAIGHENYTGSGDVLSGLTKLEEVSIPSTVTTIYPQSFANDSALKKVTFIESAENDTSQLTTIGYGAFQGCFAVAPTGTSSNVELLLPARLTSIGASAFQDCSYLAKVTVNTNNNSPSTFTVGESAFKNDTNLATVELPNYTTTIGKECFKTCRNLLNCNLPSQLTAIEDSTFEGCTNLWKE
ncbi:MAG: leucine-rich repeat domain-containing protein, partial [Lachnospiraceae bacterium]|nr:leucine-rich repeat domain-containing protein [Lachnospiraceae bacterium]